LQNLINAIILGIVQGVIEWLPISSQGNLVLLMFFFLGSETEKVLNYTVYLHLGTSIAALIFFREDIIRIILRRGDEGKRLFSFLIISTLLTGLIGYPLFLFIKTASVIGETIIALTGFALIVTGLVQRNSKRYVGKKAANVNNKDGLILGIVQAFSIVPGISRSGVTSSAFLFKGYEGGEALKLSFLMSVPASLAANMGLFIIEGLPSIDKWVLLSIITSFFTAYIFIGVLLRYVRKMEFWKLCIFLGSLAIITFIPSLLSFF
jgi:undecaprenyl-diphosphatase